VDSALKQANERVARKGSLRVVLKPDAYVMTLYAARVTDTTSAAFSGRGILARLVVVR
jgi:hypothetical protein